MGFIFLILSFYGYLIFLIRYSKWSTASMPLFIISTEIIILFASGFVDLLLPTLWCFIGLGICLGFISLYAARRNLIQLLTSLLEPGPVILFPFSVVFFTLSYLEHCLKDGMSLRIGVFRLRKCFI